MSEADYTLSFFGGTETVTGANFLLSGPQAKIMIDCGLFQARRFCEEHNCDVFPYNPADSDTLLITHAHTDHIGRIPKLVHDGFEGVIFSTEATRDIAKPMLEDGFQIMQEEAERTGAPLPYDAKDIERSFARWETVPYHTRTKLPGGFDLRLKDAGHILGSAIVELTHKERTIAFTGDLGNSPAPLLRDVEFVKGAHYLVMESVYGDRNHESLEERRTIIEDAIEDTVRRGGTLIIPAFSLERTQILLYELNTLVEEKRVPAIPVFLDSPLAITLTEIYRKHARSFNASVQKELAGGDDIFQFPNLTFTRTVEESKAINDVAGPKIVIAGSGMSHGGRILHHERRYLPDPNSTLLIVGYQAAGSLGRRLQEGVKDVSIWGERIPVRARIMTVRGYSAHMDSDHLLQFVERTADTLSCVYVTMGEPRSSRFLAQRIRDYLGVSATVPTLGQSVALSL